MTDKTTNPEPEELEALLPWYATAKLDDADAERIAARLAADPDFARQEELVREELAETITANEALGTPSAGLAARVMERIEAEAGPAPLAQTMSQGLMDRIGQWLADLAPRQMAFAGAAAALLILAQAGIIATYLASGSGGTTMQVASQGETPATGPALIVGFQADADIGQITALLDSLNAKIVEGPMPGGLFRVSLIAKDGETIDLKKISDELRARNSIVRMVLPGS